MSSFTDVPTEGAQHTAPSHTAAEVNKYPKKPCHNCRRSRLRCDQSFPSCNKCIHNGKECLGYQKYFSWVNGAASRGKMMGRSFGNVKKTRTPKEASSPVKLQDQRSLIVIPKTPDATKYLTPLSPFMIDPLFQDLDQNSRFYLSYFDRYVCKDLVIYDKPSKNPFRDLLPFTGEYKSLLHVVRAISAFHFTNALRRHRMIAAQKSSSDPAGTTQDAGSRNMLETSEGDVYRYALTAKQQALRSLYLELKIQTKTNIMVTLACVLLFIELELVESGKNNWRPHVEGSRKLLEYLGTLQDLQVLSKNPMMQSLISGCLVYDILGTMTSSAQPSLQSSIDISPLLKNAEANHFLSCPGEILQILQAVSQLQTSTSPSASDSTSSSPVSPNLSQQTCLPPNCPIDTASLLLRRAQSFNSEAWATALQHTSPRDDWESRMHIASAHKAAVCIYISEALPSTSHTLTHSVEDLASQICAHVAHITIDDDLIKSTGWPLFIAGAATSDPVKRKWVIDRLNVLWQQLPWGCVKSTTEVLERIWEKHTLPGGMGNWVQEVRVLDFDWLIT